ncbi:MAG: DUF3738 domain-containing protein [Bacteroidota bacterium]
MRNSKDVEHYNYNLTLPLERVNKAQLMEVMQQDLKRSFGYETSVEDREMRAWKLVAKPGAIERLKTKGGKFYDSPGTHAAGFEFRNVSSTWFADMISFYFPHDEDHVVDETGITGNIDFSLDADMTNVEDVRKAIQKQGFDLVKGKKMMKVVVVRDPLKQ